MAQVRDQLQGLWQRNVDPVKRLAKVSFSRRTVPYRVVIYHTTAKR